MRDPHTSWILYGAVAASIWFVLAFCVLAFFCGVKRVNGGDDDAS